MLVMKNYLKVVHVPLNVPNTSDIFTEEPVFLVPLLADFLLEALGCVCATSRPLEEVVGAAEPGWSVWMSLEAASFLSGDKVGPGEDN